MSHVMDDSYDLMIDFMKTLHDQNKGIGNIYVAKTVDKNGNVTSVRYGKNMMTDHGMSEYFVSNANFPTNMYIGQGSTDVGFNHTTCAILDRFDCVSTLVSSTKNYAYPMYFDKVSGLVTCVCKALQVKFPLNIEGISDDIRITEYGIGTAWNQLWTHSWVYATDGYTSRYGSIIKHPEEELYIDVYYCLSYFQDLILDNRALGKNIIITTMERFFNRMQGTFQSFRRGNRKVNMTSSYSRSAFTDNQITSYNNLSAYTMQYVWTGDDTAKMKSGYTDGYIDWYTGFLMFEHELLNDPEAFAAVVRPDADGVDCISSRFGQFSEYGIPFTMANILSSKTYSMITHDWTDTETFSNDINKWYTETCMQSSFACPIYYTNNNTTMRLNVYQNLNTNDPITAFDLNLTTIYAAEKYWDKTTWHHITNLEIVPNNHTNEYNHTMNCQTAHYYLTSNDTDGNGNLISMVPHRTLNGFKIIPETGNGVETIPYVSKNHYTARSDVNSNPTNGWFKQHNQITSITQGRSYAFSEFATRDAGGRSFAYNNWLFQSNNVWGYGRANDYYIDYVNLTDMSAKPAVLRYTIPSKCGSGTNTVMRALFYKSETATGYVTMQSVQFNYALLVNMKNNNAVTFTEYSTDFMCAIYGRDAIAYVEHSDQTKVKVYAFGTTNDVIQEFAIPTGFSLSFMYGHSNYVWLVSSNTSNADICCNISTGEMNLCTMSSGVMHSNRHSVNMTAVDDVLMIYSEEHPNPTNYRYIRLDAPTVINNCANMLSTNDGYESRCFLFKLHTGTIACLVSRRTSNYEDYCQINQIVDFGNFMDANTQYRKSESLTNIANFVPYGKYIIKECNTLIPVEHFLPHKITGTTKSVTSINGYINLRNKQFITTITNIPLFNGRPPGDKQ